MPSSTPVDFHAPDRLVLSDGRELNVCFDEARVPEYVLPDPLVLESGVTVRDSEAWRLRREELLELFRTHVYGHSPDPPESLRSELLESDPAALGGRAVREQVRLCFGPGDTPRVDVLIYRPTALDTAVPAFLGLNFFGNHSIHADPAILLSDQWMPDDPKHSILEHRATEGSRAAAAGRWPVETIVERGYALVVAYCGDLDPDYDDGFRNGVHPLFYRAGQSRPDPDQWGSIGAWSWGLSRILDYLGTHPAVDARRVAVIGHSRLGKCALWAAAQDERFALAISNDSGCCGAALSRRRFGETVEAITTVFPHWFAQNLNRYVNREETLPVDQHMLLALIAPRPLYVASAASDSWADPRGEFRAAQAAEPVYRLLGAGGLGTDSMPEVDRPTGSDLAYHVRTGGHDLTPWDWLQYLDFADRHLMQP
jgi:hypothetical protein